MGMVSLVIVPGFSAALVLASGMPARGLPPPGEDLHVRHTVTAREGFTRYVVVSGETLGNDAELWWIADELLLRTTQSGVLQVRFWIDPGHTPRRMPAADADLRYEAARISVNEALGLRELRRLRLAQRPAR